MKKFLIINGPNLNMLGLREPDVYGSLTLNEIIAHTETRVKDFGFDINVEWYQSNIEGEIVSKIQSALSIDITALIINPAAYSHTSVAILDALKIVKKPIVEVHLSNTNKRDEFRQKKLTAMAADVIIEGQGKNSYLLALLSQLL